MLLAVPAWAGDAEVGMVDRNSGEWHVREPNGSDRSFFYGNPGDIPAHRRLGLRRSRDTRHVPPGLGFRVPDEWEPGRQRGRRRRSSSTTSGFPATFPSPATGTATAAIVPASIATVKVFLRDTAEHRFRHRAFYFGVPGDRPFAGDWDGDGIDTVGIYRNGTGQIFYTNENPVSGVATTANDFFYGIPSDRVRSRRLGRRRRRDRRHLPSRVSRGSTSATRTRRARPTNRSCSARTDGSQSVAIPSCAMHRSRPRPDCSTSERWV